jgi:hypothetical protein
MRVSYFVLKIILCLKSQLRLDVGGEMPALKPSCKPLAVIGKRQIKKSKFVH